MSVRTPGNLNCSSLQPHMVGVVFGFGASLSRLVTSLFQGPIWSHIHHQKADDVIYVL